MDGCESGLLKGRPGARGPRLCAAIVAAVAAIVVAVAFAVAPVVAAADLDTMRRSWLDLLEREAHVLAPKRTRAAEAAVERVESVVRRQPDAALGDRVPSAIAAIATADSTVTAARTALAPMLAARSAARALDAPRTAPRDWRAAEAALVAAAEKLEAGRPDLAERFAAEAQTRFDRLRFAALRGNVLAEAQTGVGRLEARDGRKWVPRSTVRALDAVAAAEKLLRERGEADAAVRAAAATANNEVQHALFLLERVRGACEGNDPARLESAVLDWEAALQRTLERSNTSADFSAGMSAGLESLEVRVTRLVRERDAERAWSRNRGSASDSLRLAVTALAESLRARDIAIASLQQLRRRQLRIEGLQHEFARSEGRILQDGPDVVLRLPGVTFVAGQAALTPESTPVLEKVAAALAQFPGARFVVEGHSDAQGPPETNLQLSQQRADAVRADLIVRARLEPSRITAVGRGSARPIAAETDAAGREANRRIEIVIAPVD